MRVGFPGAVKLQTGTNAVKLQTGDARAVKLPTGTNAVKLQTVLDVQIYMQEMCRKYDQGLLFPKIRKEELKC